MTEDRRLTAEMRREPERYMVSVEDALHDLDLAEAENALLIGKLACCPECAYKMTDDYNNGVCLPCQLNEVLDTLEERNRTLATAQATITQRDTEIARLQDLVFQLGKLNADMNKLFPIRCFSEPGSPLHQPDGVKRNV